jgi:hypothetical protein
MRKSETFKREAPGTVPAWLTRLQALNAQARAEGKPEPFGGRPTLGDMTEDYPAGGRVTFTGRTGAGTVTLSWED